MTNRNSSVTYLFGLAIASCFVVPLIMAIPSGRAFAVPVEPSFTVSTASPHQSLSQGEAK